MKGLVSLLLLSFSAQVVARVWMSREGVEMEADLVKVEGDTVVLKIRATGKELEAPITEFATKDQEYCKKIRDDQKKEEEKGNWDAPWPKNVSTPDDLEIIDVAGNPDSGKFVYLSPHYEFVCDVRLTKSVVRSFAKLFEATHRSMEELPFNFQRALQGGGDKRHKILLFETKGSYIKNGGPPSSAGVYIGGRDGGKVMVPLTSLGVKPLGSGYTRDRKRSNKTLAHELVHQLTDYPYYSHGARGWFTEGLAEYVAVSQASGDRFSFQNNLDEIRDYATAYGKDGRGGRALGKEISLPDLRGYMLQSYVSFTSNANFNYGMGMLITAYFIHMDDEGSRKNLVAFLKAAKKGRSGEALLDVLRAGRTWEELAADISKSWRRKGVKIEIGENS